MYLRSTIFFRRKSSVRNTLKTRGGIVRSLNSNLCRKVLLWFGFNGCQMLLVMTCIRRDNYNASGGGTGNAVPPVDSFVAPSGAAVIFRSEEKALAIYRLARARVDR